MTGKENNEVTLSDQAMVMLLDEIAAMARARRSFVTGLAVLEDPAMGQLGRAAKWVREGISRGKSAPDSIAALSSRFRTPIRISLELMSETGSTQPVHEAIRLIRSANEYRNRVWVSAINPMLNVFVSAAVAFFVLPWILVALSEAELIKSSLSPTAIEISQVFVQNFLLAFLSTSLVVTLFFVALFWGFSRWWSRGDVYRDHATFCRWLAIQIAPKDPWLGGMGADLETGRVIETSASVVGADFAASWTSVVDQVRRGATTADGMAIPRSTPTQVETCIVDLVAGNRSRGSIGVDLQRLSELYQRRTQRRRVRWIQMVPRFISWLLMISIMVILIYSILSPLLDVTGKVGL